MPTYYDIVQRPPTWAEAVTELSIRSVSCYHPTPFELFCDLIGFNGEEYGMALFMPVPEEGDPNSGPVEMARLIDRTLGLLELNLLARALAEYNANSHDVKAWVRLLTRACYGEDIDRIDPDEDERCACGHGRVLDHIPGDVYPACLAIVDYDHCPCERFFPADEALTEDEDEDEDEGEDE